MSKPTFYMAVAEVEQQVEGKRKTVAPGNPVYGLEDGDADFLTKTGAVRLPTEAEVELESLRASKAESGEGSRRRRGKPEGEGEGSGI